MRLTYSEIESTYKYYIEYALPNSLYESYSECNIIVNPTFDKGLALVLDDKPMRLRNIINGELNDEPLNKDTIYYTEATNSTGDAYTEFSLPVTMIEQFAILESNQLYRVLYSITPNSDVTQQIINIMYFISLCDTSSVYGAIRKLSEIISNIQSKHSNEIVRTTYKDRIEVKACTL